MGQTTLKAIFSVLVAEDRLILSTYVRRERVMQSSDNYRPFLTKIRVEKKIEIGKLKYLIGFIIYRNDLVHMLGGRGMSKRDAKSGCGNNKERRDLHGNAHGGTSPTGNQKYRGACRISPAPTVRGPGGYISHTKCALRTLARTKLVPTPTSWARP